MPEPTCETCIHFEPCDTPNTNWGIWAVIRRAVLFCCVLAYGFVTPSHSADTGTRRPLDLPVPGAGGLEEDEDTPESILFYGASYEGDAFFWSLDRSCSMGWGGRLETLKAEFSGAVASLSARAHFGANAFGSNLVEWSGALRPATSGWKLAAISWVAGLTDSGGTCVAPAVVSGLGQLRESPRRKRRLILVSDGIPGECGSAEEQRTAILAADYEPIPIDTVWIAAGGSGADWLRSIAESTGGTFTLVP